MKGSAHHNIGRDQCHSEYTAQYVTKPALSELTFESLKFWTNVGGFQNGHHSNIPCLEKTARWRH